MISLNKKVEKPWSVFADDMLCENCLQSFMTWRSLFVLKLLFYDAGLKLWKQQVVFVRPCNSQTLEAFVGSR